MKNFFFFCSVFISLLKKLHKDFASEQSTQFSTRITHAEESLVIEHKRLRSHANLRNVFAVNVVHAFAETDVDEGRFHEARVEHVLVVAGIFSRIKTELEIVVKDVDGIFVKLLSGHNDEDEKKVRKVRRKVSTHLSRFVVVHWRPWILIQNRKLLLLL